MSQIIYNDPKDCEHEWEPTHMLSLEEERRLHPDATKHVNSYVFECWWERLCKKCKAKFHFSTFELT